MSFTARIAEIEKAATAVPEVARSIAQALRSKALGGGEPASHRADAGLPESYGRNRLVMLVVDPRQVHAYWEVTPDKLAEAHKAMDSPGLPPAVLRFHGAEGGAPDSFDVPVHLPSRNWYVNLWSPGSSYYAELGLKGDAGQFVPLVKSNVIRTPRSLPVIQVEEHFMQVDAVEQRAEPVAPPVFVRPQRERPAVSEEQPYLPTEQANSTTHQSDTVHDQVFSATDEPRAFAPMAEPQAAAPTPRRAEVHPPARINAEEILKGRLSDVFAARRASWERSQVRSREASPAPDPSLNLISLAEQRFVPGIFSHAPRKTADQT